MNRPSNSSTENYSINSAEIAYPYFPAYCDSSNADENNNNASFSSFCHQLFLQSEIASNAGMKSGAGAPLNLCSYHEALNGGQAGSFGPTGANIFVFHMPSDLDNWSLYMLFRKFGTVCEFVD